ncbi:hypothetical protein VNI00_011584 [Paramarasmius palmivorus]|uniref:Nephrocystin 3-like N-terminal domain-containing protein n=1 Tax=Paramarasmius palmivorus TaxID=297713 RepID=A0AAW0CDI1_9AGAR
MAFNGSSNFTNYGGAHNVVYGNQINTTNHFDDDRNGGPLLLIARAAMNACHDAEARYPPPNCSPNTRVNPLGMLGRWIEDKDTPTRVFWVHGSVGVGKSAIAQKISEDYSHHLIGSFFFSRNDSTRNKLDPFIATLAYQCCTSELLRDVVGPIIINTIRSNPNILNTTIETQLRKLILEPFSKIIPTQRRGLPNLIVIDAIDECVDLTLQVRLIEIIDLAITFTTRVTSGGHFPFIFLLCSRLEPQIRDTIDNAAFSSCLERIEISGTTIRFLGHLSEADLDIQKYLLERFGALRRKYRRVLRSEGETWPSEDVVRDLVWRASGQFIFASTVIKYIDTLDELPQDRLETILMTKPNKEIQGSPYPDLDILYRQILSACPAWDKVSTILRLLVTPHPNLRGILTQDIHWHSPLVIAGLFKLKWGQVETLLSRLHAVLHVPEEAYSPIYILHASFTEFLLGSARSGEYCVQQYSEAEYCDHVTVLLLHTFSSFATWYPIYHISKDSRAFGTLSDEWQNRVRSDDILLHFAITYWPDYRRRVQFPSANLLAELEKFDPCLVGDLTVFSSYNIALVFSDWKDCVAWAKTLGEKAPVTFIKRMDDFFQACHIAYSPTTWRMHAVRRTFSVECGFCTFDIWQDREEILDIVCKYFQGWWNDSESNEHGGFYGLLFPSTYNLVEVLPKNWVTDHATQFNGDILRKMYYIRKSLDEDARGVFDSDIIYNTLESIDGRKLVKVEEDLVEFKALLYERRDLFVNLPTPHPKGDSFSGDDTVMLLETKKLSPVFGILRRLWLTPER